MDSKASNKAEPNAQATLNELQELRALLEAQGRLFQEQSEELKVLRTMSDPTDYKTALQKVNPDKKLRVRLTTVDGKIVARWDDMVKNERKKINGVEKVTQVVRLHFIDGTSEELDFETYVENRTLTEELPVIETSTVNGETSYTVVLPDGTPFTTHIKFLN